MSLRSLSWYIPKYLQKKSGRVHDFNACSADSCFISALSVIAAFSLAPPLRSSRAWPDNEEGKQTPVQTAFVRANQRSKRDQTPTPPTHTHKGLLQQHRTQTQEENR